MMQNIQNSPYRTILRSLKRRTATAAATALAVPLGFMFPGTAQAQLQYIGNAYSARVDVNVIGGGVNLGTALNNTGNLAPFNQQTLIGLGATAGADINSGTGSGLLASNLLSADVDTVQTSSVFPPPASPASLVVRSTAAVTNLGLLNSLLSPLAGLGLGISATAVQSQTDAFFSGFTQGTTTITNLNLGFAFRNQNGTPATILTDVNGQIIANQVFQVSILNLGSLLNVGTLTINEQRINTDDSRTTEAIHLRLLNDNVLGTLANADIVVASSTAGYAPEPGSLALVAAGLLPAAGFLLRRRRSAKTPS